MLNKVPIRALSIDGTGHYLPQLQVANDEFRRLVDTSDEWIRTRTGIRSRHLAEGEATWYMGAQAARAALADADCPAAEVDVILVATVTPDYATPSNACIIQAEIGAGGAFCMDLNVACSGFVYAFDLASRYLQDPAISTVLIVATELLSAITDFTDRSTCVLFGDGAAAVLVRRGDGTRGIHAVELGAQGEKGDVLTCAIERPTSPFAPADRERFPLRFPDARPALQMAGREVFRFAVTVLADSVRAVLEKSGATLEDLDYVIPHQANDRILEAAAKRLGIAPDRLYAGLDTIGNTSSVSIPLALDKCRRSGRIKRGDTIAICGFGGGLTYGAALFTL
ncbi:MAG: beta-ketoacyl-ACP synthase III [Bacillota bacterium]|nr:beta-ketoacyl-ACP synthase III [Bacillota bacterium]